MFSDKQKAKFAQKEAMKAHRSLGTKFTWVVNATPRPLYPRERQPVTTVLKAELAPGPVWTGAENLAATGIRSPDRLARSESLYRLRYRGPLFSERC